MNSNVLSFLNLKTKGNANISGNEHMGYSAQSPESDLNKIAKTFYKNYAGSKSTL